MAAKIILAVECPNCGEMAKSDETTIDFMADENVACLNNFSHTEFKCQNCGAQIYVGDVEVIGYEE
jgi:predicted RNA-binding Zn-ribbon protein involved in translation (DUF1610 family)|nr:MAG TPA: MqsA [Bacteriophage sp.]